MSIEDNQLKWDKKYYKIFSLKSIIGTLVGLIAGLIYFYKIGCSSGSCAITSNIWLTLLWGGLMGYLFGGMLEKEKKKSEK